MESCYVYLFCSVQLSGDSSTLLAVLVPSLALDHWVLFHGVGELWLVGLSSHHHRTSVLFLGFGREIREKVVHERMEKELPPNKTKKRERERRLQDEVLRNEWELRGQGSMLRENQGWISRNSMCKSPVAEKDHHTRTANSVNLASPILVITTL